MKSSPYTNDEYTIGWISALDEEFMVAMAMLDEEHGRLQSTPRDDTNMYLLGRIGEHNVAMACISGGKMGTGPAAIVAENMRRTFKNIRFALLVGIGGGVPSRKKDIRLGDIVVSCPSGTYTGIVQYDYGKLKSDGQIQRKDWFCAPPPKVLAAVTFLKTLHSRPIRPVNNMPEIIDKLGEEYSYPEEHQTLDVLYEASYEHPDKAETCNSCDKEAIITRVTRKLPQKPRIHYGTIASGNMVIKSGLERDKIDERYENSILCFEMEAAGLMNNFQCLVIRGICDYSDSHKNDDWHKRAIAVASAYAKELLLLIEPSEVEVLPPIAARALDIVSTNLAKIDRSTSENKQLLQKAAEETRQTQQRDLHMRCEKWLKPLNVRQIQQDQIQGSVQGTCGWIWSNTTFTTWYEASVPWTHDGLMCISGPPGCGKSILASSMADRIWNNDVPALFFAFSSMHANHQEPTALIRSLLWQLLEIAPWETNYSLLEKSMLRGQPTISELWTTFNTMAESISRPVYCIIDGIDESPDPTQLRERFPEFLKAHSNFRFILLGRQHAFQGINSTRHELEIRPVFTKGDVERVIEIGIEQSKILRLPELRDKVSESLRNKSDGNFLWLKLMLGHLGQSLRKPDVLERLNNLPRDLEAAYGKLLLGLVTRLKPEQLKLAQRIVAFIITAQRPLSVCEFQHLLSADAMSIRTCDQRSLDDQAIFDLKDKISQYCGGLINAIDDKLQLVHFSVKEFLVRPQSEWSRHFEWSRHRKLRNIMSFRVEVEDAHRWFGLACIKYFETCDFEFPFHDQGELSNLRQYHFLHYSSTYLMTHIHRSGLLSSSILRKIETFIVSDRWIAWLDLFALNTIDDGSLHSQEDEYQKFVSWLGKHSENLLQKGLVNLKNTLNKREKEYGHEDSRTEHIRLILDYFEYLRASAVTSEASDSSAVQTISPPASLRPILQLFRKEIPLSSQSQVDLLLRMQIYLLKARELTRPLEVIFRMILQNASSMPVYALLLVGGFYRKVRKFEQALEIYFVALQKVNEREERVKFIVIFWIGVTYHDLTQYNRALEKFHCALEGRKKLLGPEHRQTLNTTDWIGQTYYELTHYDLALEKFQYTLEGRKKLLGPQHRHTCQTAYAIGLTYFHLTEYGLALEQFQYTLEGERKLLGLDHRDTLYTGHWIGQTYFELTQYDQALETFQTVLEKRKKLLGSEHEETLDTAHWIGHTYVGLTQYDQALHTFQYVLEGERKILGPEHEDTLNTLCMMGLSSFQLGRDEDALECLAKVLEGERKLFGPDHEDNLKMLYMMGVSYYRLSRNEDTLKCLAKVLTDQEIVLGPGHKGTLNTLYMMGLSSYQLGRDEDALECLAKVLEGERKLFGPEHEDTLNTLYMMGVSSYELGRDQDALDYLTKALVGLEKTFGSEHEDTLRTLYRMGVSSYELGRDEDALKCLKRALAGQEKTLGSEHEDTSDTLYWIGVVENELQLT